MALESSAKKTEHSGAKNMSHDKPAKRADMKEASNKRRRSNDKKAVAEIVFDGVPMVVPTDENGVCD